MSRIKKQRSLRHPIHWPMWMGIGLFHLLILLPWPAQLFLGRLFGRISFFFLRARRRVIAVNLKLCFPDLSKTQLRKLATAHHEAIGIGLFETCMAWWAPDRRLPRYRVEGRENLETAIAARKGVILLSAHFTTLEICGRFFTHIAELGGLYRDPDNAVVAHEMHRRRIDKMAAAIPMDDLRGLIRALKAGHTIWYAPDQGKKTKLSAILPFFGEPAITNIATSRIAAMTGSAVVPFFGERRPDGTYVLRLMPALENFPTEDANADALRINSIMEKYIRLAPDQYFWVHRRFKRRGRLYKNVYRRKKKRPKIAQSADD